MEPGRSRAGRGRYARTLDDKDLARIRQTMDLLRDPPQLIRIGAGDSTLTVTDRSGAESTWRIDRKWVRQKVEGGGDLETLARWDGEDLVIERKVDGGGRITATCRLGLGGSRLVVFVDVAGLPQPLALRWLYDPADSAGAAPDGR